jgi:hypothetical protein
VSLGVARLKITVKQLVTHYSIGALSMGIGCGIAQAMEKIRQQQICGAPGSGHFEYATGWPFESARIIIRLGWQNNAFWHREYVERFANGFLANVGVWTIIALLSLEAAVAGLHSLYKWHKRRAHAKSD